MHIHLPKALHGWREVAREMTIIIATGKFALRPAAEPMIEVVTFPSPEGAK
jgi:hypothetical protein